MKAYQGSLFSSAILALWALGGMGTAGAATTPTLPMKSVQISYHGRGFLHTQGFVRGGTTYLPLNTVLQSLRNLGISARFEQQDFMIDNLNMGNIVDRPSQGSIDILVGPYRIANVPIVDGLPQYIPIWYVMQALKQVGVNSIWNGRSWTLLSTASPGPSTARMEHVMCCTVELGTEMRFALTGSPLTVSDGEGGTFTAVVGTRYPTADGYGQVVYFFHNNDLVGWTGKPGEVTEVQKMVKRGANTLAITYANYTPADPLSNPSLAPVTLTYHWADNAMHTSGFLPIGTLVPKLAVSYTGSITSTDIQSAVKSELLRLLPIGSTPVSLPGGQETILRVRGTGLMQPAYVMAYRNADTGTTPSQVGVMVASGFAGTMKEVWNQPNLGMTLKELNAGDVTGNGQNDIVLQASVSAMANHVLVLHVENGKWTPILNTYGFADVGNFIGNPGAGKQVALWVEDTGPLYDISMYHWSKSTAKMVPVANADFPKYFQNFVLPYYVHLYKQNLLAGQSPANPPKMVAYGVAESALDAGIKPLALKFAKIGLSQPATDYPSNQRLEQIVQAAK
ncbi:hypothetical protein D2Q93_05145 [Alicyclobacillaceae bacterium I2511]|nr:hypothetical protein D2Q93_05145 [Alicyclobacillaceae bacterium I2511]